MPRMFEKYADDYARFRPGYPPDMIKSLIDRFNISEKSLILDLACGTGNLGRSILEVSNTQIFGLDKSMVLLRHNNVMSSVYGVSESLPIQNNQLDLVVVGQAFHWFDFDRACVEIGRVLKTGGGFVIAWYRRAKPLAGHRLKLDKLVRELNPDYKPGFMDYNWKSVINKYELFDNISEFETTITIEYAIDDYLKLQRSKSYVGDSMNPEVLEEWYNRAENILRDEYPDGKVPEKMQYFYTATTYII